MSHVRMRGLAKSFGPVHAVRELNLDIERGELLAVLGPSGCGKTTLLRLIAGFEQPDAGCVVVSDEVVAGPGRMVPPEKRRVGMVFQDYALFPHLTVQGNVGFGLSTRPREEREDITRRTLELVGLQHKTKCPVFELSGGERQRVALARALAPEPDLVLLDEPFSNLDADLRTVMREEIQKILRLTGTTAVFVTHDQQEAFTVADRVGVLHAGHLAQVDTPYEVYHHPATRFVAEFVGEADFLRCMVKEEGIVSEIGTFRNPNGHPVGLPVDMMVRPDDVDFIPHPDGEVVVAGRQFHGSENLYRLRLASGARVHSVQPSTTLYPIGTRVRVVANMIHVVAFALGD
jgi:iron(III) transport system ATP-binding protein